jgi:hypothetical protein
MAYSFRDYFPQSPNSRSKGPATPRDEPSNFPKSYQLFPSPNFNNPFGDLPKIQTPQKPLNIWNDPPTPPALDLERLRPMLRPVPPPTPTGTTNPFSDPSKTRLPPIPPPQEPPPYDLGPSNFPGQGGNELGGLLGMLLRAMMQQNKILPDAESASSPDNPQVEATSPQEFATAPQKPVRILSRQIVR